MLGTGQWLLVMLGLFPDHPPFEGKKRFDTPTACQEMAQIAAYVAADTYRATKFSYRCEELHGRDVETAARAILLQLKGSGRAEPAMK